LPKLPQGIHETFLVIISIKYQTQWYSSHRTNTKRGKHMNETIKKQLDHRSIREFKNEPIPKETIDLLMEVAKRTATSSSLQASSIIRITDPQLKLKISEISKQEYVSRIPLFLIFIVDQYRNNQIAVEQGVITEAAAGMDGFLQSFTDAVLMAQNVVNAAESMELGTLYLGSILNDAAALSKLLDLPPLTFPVLGLAIGTPNQNPALKPRMSMDLRVFENQYGRYENYLSKIKDYDELLQTYYDLRDTHRRVDSFSLLVAKRMMSPNLRRSEILNVVAAQGFDLKVKP
jgi:nitroreductase